MINYDIKKYNGYYVKSYPNRGNDKVCILYSGTFIIHDGVGYQFLSG